MSFKSKFTSGYVGKKDSMRDKAQRLMRKELGPVREYPDSSRARSLEKIRPYKRGGRIPTDMHYPTKIKAKSPKGLADVSGLQGSKSGGKRYARGGHVRDYDEAYTHPGKSSFNPKKGYAEGGRYAHGGKAKKKRYAVGGEVEGMGISPFEQSQIDTYNSYQRSGAKPAQVQGDPMIRQRPPIPEEYAANMPGRTRGGPDEPMEGEAPAEAPAAPGLGYRAAPQQDRRMGLAGRARLGAEQFGRMAQHYADKAGRAFGPVATKYMPQISNAVRGAARQYAPRAQEYLGRVNPTLGKAFGSARKFLGFKNGGQVDMKRCSNGGNVYEREMMGEHHGKRNVNYEGQMKGEHQSRARQNFAAGGVGKMRHGQANKAGKQIKGRHFGAKKGR